MKRLATAFLLALAAGISAAAAHPHVWVGARSEIVFDAAGRVAAVRARWTFDEAFSAFALQGLDTDRDGAYSPAELAPLAETNIESLAEYGYFTRLLHGSEPVAFAPPRDYAVEKEGDRLVLAFTLPLADPVGTEREITLQVFDPDYFVAMVFEDSSAARLAEAPSDCLIEVRPATGPDPEAAALLATIGADDRALPPGLRSATAGIENAAIVDCGPDAAAIQARRAAPHSASEAAALMASGVPSRNIELEAAPAE